MGAQMVYLREPVTQKEVEDGGAKPESECLHFGVCAMQGWRRNMEDAHLAVLELDKDISFFGVFDGHGGRGVSRFAAKHLPGLLRETEEFQKGEYARALEKAFLRVDEELRKDDGRRQVESLDRPEPGAPSHPIVVPRRVLQRFLGQNSGPSPAADNSDEEEEGSGKGAKGGEEDAPNGNAKEKGDAAKAEHWDEWEAPDTSGEDGEDKEKADGEADSDELEEVQLGDGEDNENEDDDPDPEWGDEEMALVDPSRLTRDPSPEAQGCTAVAVLCVRRKDGEGPRLFCANAGDSRAVLGRAGAAVALSEDHKPENPEETARITKAGGTVQHMPGGARVQGDLNLSRAMGDLRYKKPMDLPPEQQILTVFPEVRTFQMTEQDEFMVIGCDGIWERIDNQGVVDFVGPRIAAKEGADKLSTICAEICDRGLCPSMDMGENSSFDGTGCDNMTVMVVQLKKQITVDASKKRPAEADAEGAGDGKKLRPGDSEEQPQG